MNELTREERAAQNRPSGIDWDAFKEFKATLPAGFQLCHGAGCGHDDCEVGEYLRMKHKEEREARLEGYGREFDRAVGNVPTKDDIAKLKSDYIDLRAAVDAANQDYSERRESYQERIDAIEREFTEANAELIETRTLANADFAETESKLRSAVIAHYESTGEKTIDENLSVRVNTSFEYKERDAIAWAEDNAPVMIAKVIDKKAFEKFADGLDFVTKKEKVTAVLKGLKPEVA